MCPWDLVAIEAELLMIKTYEVTAGPLIELGYSMRDWLYQQDYLRFKARWRWMRLTVGLQTRLFMEQVFWIAGDPWRRLITGFRPIE